MCRGRAAGETVARPVPAYVLTTETLAAGTMPAALFEICYHSCMNDLTHKKCIPCQGGMPHLMADEIETLRKEVPQWEVKDWHELKRRFRFKNFAEALVFVNKVGALAESEGHHPDITFGWGYADITLFTHAVDGLSENDFILATKIDRL